MKKAPFAAVTLQEINNADPSNSTLEENPYTGIQFVAIPRFQSFASKVGKQISSILSGKTSIDRGLMISQKIVYRQMLRGKYIQQQCVDNTQITNINNVNQVTSDTQTNNGNDAKNKENKIMEESSIIVDGIDINVQDNTSNADTDINVQDNTSDKTPTVE